MTVGSVLLCKMLEERRIHDFLKLKAESFMGDEVKLYRLISQHVQEYGSLPTLKSIQTKIDISDYDSYTEPYNYYYREFQSRFVYNLFNQILPVLNTNISHKDGLSILTIVRNMIATVNETIAPENKDVYSLSEVFEITLEELRQRRLCNGVTGIPTGWASLDRATHGFQKGDIFLVVARVKIGKTACMIYMASHAQRHGFRPMFVSMEMSKIQIGERLLCLNTGLNINHIRSGEITSKAEEMIIEEIQNQRDNLPPFYYLEGQLKKNVNEIAVVIENYRPDIVFIDGAYLIKPPTQTSQRSWEQISDVVNSLKTMAIEFDIPIVTSYQFNRQVHRRSQTVIAEAFEKIQLSDAISQLASSGIAILNDPDSPENVKIIELIGGRYGEAGAFRIHWDWERMNFSEIENDYETNLEEDRIIW